METKINIFGTEWTIMEVEEKLVRVHSEEDMDECDGVCHYDSQTIYVRSDVHPHRKRLIVCHELIHAMLDYVGYYNDKNRYEKEEKLVRMLEHHVLSLIDNFPEEYKCSKTTTKP